MGTVNRVPQFGVHTISVGTVVPTNLSEQPIGNQFSVPTFLVGTALFLKGCGNTMWFLLSGKEKVIYQMKKIGIRL